MPSVICGWSPQVPAEALLDLEVRNYLDTPQPPEEHSGSGGVQGEIAFLSHEPVVSSTCVRSKQRLGELQKYLVSLSKRPTLRSGYGLA